MNIQQAISVLIEERQNATPSRFPCRAIMVKNVQEYSDLLSELKKINGARVISSSELFSSYDVLQRQ